MIPVFISDSEKIDKKIKSLKEVKISKGGWIKRYIDERTKEEWVLSFYHAEMHGNGFPVLKKLPHLSINNLIELALSSKNIDEIRCASFELQEREKFHNSDFRDYLIQKLNQIDTSNLPLSEKERLTIIIKNSTLDDPINRRTIVGKHYTEIAKDAEHYRSISDKANKILNNINR